VRYPRDRGDENPDGVRRARVRNEDVFSFDLSGTPNCRIVLRVMMMMTFTMTTTTSRMMMRITTRCSHRRRRRGHEDDAGV